MTLEELELSLTKDEVLQQVYEALKDMSYTLRRAEEAMRQPTKYIALAQDKAQTAMTAITEVLEKP
jgi:uncharacterized protein YoxC